MRENAAFEAFSKTSTKFNISSFTPRQVTTVGDFGKKMKKNRKMSSRHDDLDLDDDEEVQVEGKPKKNKV